MTHDLALEKGFLSLLPAVTITLALGCSDDQATTADGAGGGTLDGKKVMDPMTIPKFVQTAPVPAVLDPMGQSAGMTDYRIVARQFVQQVLPAPMPATTVWGYGRDGDPLPGTGAASSFGFPGPTIEARSNSPVRITWINGLTDDTGGYLQHLLPVDATLHWADPGGAGHEHHGGGARYTGPVPIVTHVHGAHSYDHSDGHPEAWFLPAATNIPDGFSRRGPMYRSQGEAGNGAATFEYPLDEKAATLWYHDHTLGMTRLNIAAGLAGFFIIRDEVEDGLDLPGPAPRAGDSPDTRHYEIPLVIQDRTFAEDGSLLYPDSRTDYDGYKGPFVPETEVSPIWGPEFFGNTIVVNGRAWPYLEVEPRLYRFRLLNAADARTLILSFDRAGLEFVQIGGDGGLLPDAPLRHTQMVVAPAERMDILVDFSMLTPGDAVTLLNSGPDEAWGGPYTSPPQDPANPETTGRIMQFSVVEPTGQGNAGRIPETLPSIASLSTTLPPRDLLLVELSVEGDFPTHDYLGTVAVGPVPWAAPATEIVKLGDTEIWRVANTTGDAHPIHIHLIDFQVLDRTPFDADAFEKAEVAWLDGTGPQPVLEDFFTGPPEIALPAETGPKDTMIMYPGYVSRLIARFDRAGTYVWHCHIIEHEDNDMMRPLVIVP